MILVILATFVLQTWSTEGIPLYSCLGCIMLWPGGAGLWGFGMRKIILLELLAHFWLSLCLRIARVIKKFVTSVMWIWWGCLSAERHIGQSCCGILTLLRWKLNVTSCECWFCTSYVFTASFSNCDSSFSVVIVACLLLSRQNSFFLF